MGAICCKTLQEKQTQNVDVKEDRFIVTMDSLRIPVALTSPVVGVIKAAILIVPGALFSDVDGNYPQWGKNPGFYAQIAHDLAKLGYKTLRYAKHGQKMGAEIADIENCPPGSPRPFLSETCHKG